ncbi:RimK/LysX family protein [Motilimonas cestriensis]|uniref:RimK/LysX family protein n=1 Tax=Motilimonas cestriensis TaxID=2742685 RepID=A0ABS8WFW8_9GAMM|nr:RimK/LysX family protein [Motilimonas cestriensis]
MKKIVLLMCLSGLFASFYSVAEKRSVGPVEYIKVTELDNFKFLTRIDTGANTTSIHAFDIKVNNDAGKMKANIGKTVTFTTMNEKKEFRTYQAQIVDVVTIRNSIAKEQRYQVELSLSWRGESKKVVVNLSDRKKMSYKLLIGRNWLQGDYVVDVEMQPEE